MTQFTRTPDRNEVIRDPFDPPFRQDSPALTRVAWRHKWLILAGIAMGVGSAGAYCPLAPTTYSSEAQVLVIRKRPRVLPMPGVDPRLSYFEDCLWTHQTLFVSPLIVGDAVRRAKLDSLASLRDEKDPTKAIIKRMSVTRDAKNLLDENNAIFNLAYRSPVAEECKTVLSAVISSYEDYLDRTQRHDSDDIRALFIQWRDEVQKQLAQKQEAYKAFRESVPPLLWKGKQGINLSQERVAALVSERSAHLSRRTRIQEQLSALEAARKEGVDHQVLFEMISKWSTESADGWRLRGQFLDLLLEEQTLREKFGPRHPEVAGVRERIKLTRELLMGPLAQKNDPHLMDPVESYVQSLQLELRVTEGLEQSLTKLIDESHLTAKKTEELSEDLAILRDDISSMQELHNGIAKQLQQLEIAKDSEFLDAQLLSPPEDGLKTIWSRPIVILPIGLLAGALLASGLVYVVEVSNRRFRSPDEIRRRLGFSVVGHIPYHQPDAEALQKVGSDGATPALSLCTYYSPASAGAEAYRGLRTALYYGSEGQPCKVVQITSPSDGDGKSTLAANLAVSIAQSKKKVLLVDADFRRPSLHKVFGLSAKIGLATVLAEAADLNDAIKPSTVEGLRILPCGPPPPNPAELLSFPRFNELLDSMRRRWDFVLVDTSSLLAATDPSVVAPHVDGVLLCIRNSNNHRPQAERGRKILEALHANVIGVVVRGIDRRHGPRGYGYVDCRYDYVVSHGHYNGDHRCLSNGSAERDPRTAATQGTAASGDEAGQTNS